MEPGQTMVCEQILPSRQREASDSGQCQRWSKSFFSYKNNIFIHIVKCFYNFKGLFVTFELIEFNLKVKLCFFNTGYCLYFRHWNEYYAIELRIVAKKWFLHVICMQYKDVVYLLLVVHSWRNACGGCHWPIFLDRTDQTSQQLEMV